MFMDDNEALQAPDMNLTTVERGQNNIELPPLLADIPIFDSSQLLETLGDPKTSKPEHLGHGQDGVVVKTSSFTKKTSCSKIFL